MKTKFGDSFTCSNAYSRVDATTERLCCLLIHTLAVCIGSSALGSPEPRTTLRTCPGTAEVAVVEVVAIATLPVPIG